MGAVEEMLKGLPGIEGYVEKELRRDVDYRLRQTIGTQLDEQKQRLFDVQQKLLKHGGLKWLDHVDGAIQKLQILIDRVKTAPQGYAGMFDAVRIRAEDLDALHRFDVGLQEHVAGLRLAVDALNVAADNNEDMGAVVSSLTDVLIEINALFERRDEAIIDPALLAETAR